MLAVVVQYRAPAVPPRVAQEALYEGELSSPVAVEALKSPRSRSTSFLSLLHIPVSVHLAV